MQYEVAIAGAGVMGLAAAYALLKRGVKQVLVLEKSRVGHDRAASSDTTKAIRYEYGESEMYARMVGKALELWQALERETGADLYVNSGVVTWGRGDAPHARASFRTVSRMGIPIREVSPAELCSFYPQFHVADMTYATINPEGGFMRASNCVSTLARRVRELGGEIREGVGLQAMVSGSERAVLTLGNGQTVQASRVILAVGPWSSTLLPQLGVSLPVTSHKQQVVYMAGLGDEFAPGKFPVFLNLDHDFYGFPLDEHSLLKASLHLPGPLVDPDLPQTPDDSFTERIVSLLATYIPRAAKGSVRMSRVCMYAMTPDEDFFIDHVPGQPNAVLAAGFSGHGFKFGILVGELLAALSLGEETLFPMQPFALSRASRSV